jgi:hypothetical protein
MVSPNEADFILRGTFPLPYPILTGSDQPLEVSRPEGLHAPDRPEGSMDEPGLPHARSGAAVSGRDSEVTATYLISFESTFVNMGGPSDDGNESGSKELETTPENLGCVCRESAWPSYSERGKATYMGKGHSLRGGCVVIPSDGKAWESCATRRTDGMDGKSHWPSREPVSRWGSAKSDARLL